MGSSTRDLDSDGSPDDPPVSSASSKQPRRSVACKRCHSLKVKCIPNDPLHPAGPCVRCVARNHDCILDLNHVRKRRKKIDIINERLAKQGTHASSDPLAPSSPSFPKKLPLATSLARFPTIPSSFPSTNYPHQDSLSYDQDPYPHALRLSLTSNAYPGINLNPNLNLNIAHTAPPSNIHHAMTSGLSSGVPSTTSPALTPLPPMSPFHRHDNTHALAPMPSLPSQLSYMPLAPLPQAATSFDHSNHNPLSRPKENSFEPSSTSATMSSKPSSHSRTALHTLKGTIASPPVGPSNEVVRLKQRVMALESLLEKATSPSSSILSNGGSPPAELPGFVCKADLEKEVASFADLSTSVSFSNDDLLAIAGRRCTLFRSDRPQDVVTAGIVSLEDAQTRLDLYRTRLYPAFPAVNVPLHLLVSDMQQQFPLLLNAIMSVTNSLVVDNADYDTALRIDNFAVEAATNEIMVMGTKSEQLLHTLTLLCAWYNSPERFRNRRYHLLNKLCVTLVHDLGLLLRPDPSKPHEFARDVNNLSVDIRTIVLAIYSITVNICIIVRRLVFVRWLVFAEECCASLERSGRPEGLRIALDARICNVLDKIHHVLHNPDRADPYSSDYFVRNLTSQLEALRLKVGPRDHATLSYIYTVQAYLYEPCLDSYLAAQDLDSPAVFDDDTIRAITNCTRACVSCLNHFRKVPAEQVSTMPFYYVARIMYTGGILLRLRYFILSLPSQVEKGLVPLNAIDAFKSACTLIGDAIKLHPFNHSLAKCQVVLRLFIHTYASQVRELLISDDSSLSVAKMTRVHEEMSNAASKFDTDHMKSIDPNTPSQFPLLILSHAADYRRSQNGHNSRNDSVGDGAKKDSNQDAAGGATAKKNQKFLADANDNARSSDRLRTLLKKVSSEQLPALPMDSRPPLPLRQPSLSLFSQAADAFDSPRLDGAFWQLNDEFWSDLLHTSSDRVNFSNTTKPQGNFQQADDLFYAQNMGEPRRDYGA